MAAADPSPYTGPIVIGAGGTGGHMFPAQAVAEELTRRGYRLLLVTDARGMRYADRFPEAEIVEIRAANPSAAGIAAKAGAALALVGGFVRARQFIAKRKAIAAIGFGGYPSLPAMQAARALRLPYGLHEQNSLLGRANRYLARNASFLAHGFPTLTGVPARLATPCHEAGNPVRDQVRALIGSTYAPPEDGGPFRLLITGGSQGASILARIPAEALAALPNHLRERLEVIHQVREDDQDAVRSIYADAGIRAEIAAFFSDLPERLARCHLVIARSGASTVTEIAALGRPSILVPLAIAMDDHQSVNAKVLTDVGAAERIAEKDLDRDTLRSLLSDLITNPARLSKMAASADGRVKTDAATAVTDLLEQAIAGAKG